MGKLTLRQFYLLLGEWWTEQRLQDIRTYKLICPHLVNPPQASELFFSLRDYEQSQDEAEEEEVPDDERAFTLVTSALLPRT